MNLGFDLSDIAELATTVAASGAMRAVETVADEVFDYIVAVTILIQQNPSGLL